VDFNV